MCVLEHNRGKEEINANSLEFNDIALNDPTKHAKSMENAFVISLPEMTSHVDVDGGSQPTLDNLKKLCSLKEAEAMTHLNSVFGGAQNLANSLKTNLQTGLDDNNKQDLKERVAKYGKNEIPTAKSQSFAALILRAFRDPTLVMLTLCALVSIGLSFYKTGDLIETTDDGPTHATNNSTTSAPYNSSESSIQWIEGSLIILIVLKKSALIGFANNLSFKGVSIMVAVFVVVFVTAFNDWRKEKQFRGLRDCIEDQRTTSVVRNGLVQQINIHDLVVGDVCCIKYGDLIPADGLVVQASDFNVDESSLTGETNLIKKDSANNAIILSGLFLSLKFFSF